MINSVRPVSLQEVKLQETPLPARAARFGSGVTGAPQMPPQPVNPGLDQIFEELQRLVLELKTTVLTVLRGLWVEARNLLEELGEKLGFHKPVRTPRMAVGDAYTVASEGYIHQDAKDFSNYHIAFRREMTPWMKALGLKPEDSRYVFYGLQPIIEKVLQDPVTRQEVDEAERFFKTARNNGPFKWDRKIWDRVIDENGGVIPIKIEALPDGSVTFPGEPVIQVSAKDGFGELAAWFEAKLVQVWATSERASMVRHWLEYNKDLVRRCTDKELSDEEVTKRAQRLMADFSDRSGRTQEESEMLGMATLTSMPVTATVGAAYQAWKAAGENVASNLSMYSLAHRVVESYPEEKQAYLALFDFARGDFGSYVADCYNYENAVSTMLVPLALQAKKEAESGGPRTIIGARPDSGEPYRNIKFALEAAVSAVDPATSKNAGLYGIVTARDGRKLVAMTHLKVIQADSMNFQTMMQINEKLMNEPVYVNGEKIADGYSPVDCVIYGVGGYLADEPKRGNTSAAMKLSAAGLDQKKKMKSPKEERGKESIPGVVKIVREGADQSTVRLTDEPGENRFVTWYDGTNLGEGLLHAVKYREDFRAVQRRVVEDFKKDAYPGKARLLSDAIRAEQARVRALHHGEDKPQPAEHVSSQEEKQS